MLLNVAPAQNPEFIKWSINTKYDKNPFQVMIHNDLIVSANQKFWILGAFYSTLSTQYKMLIIAYCLFNVIHC
jgi:hypothetical protein